MENTLMDFLSENQASETVKQVEISQRLKGKPFTIRAMSGSEHNEYLRLATTIGKKRKVSIDMGAYNQALIINHTTIPSFKDAAWIKRCGCVTPEQLLNKVLLAGEVAELANQITALSGFDQDMDELVDEAKNS